MCSLKNYIKSDVGNNNRKNPDVGWLNIQNPDTRLHLYEPAIQPKKKVKEEIKEELGLEAGKKIKIKVT